MKANATDRIGQSIASADCLSKPSQPWNIICFKEGWLAVLISHIAIAAAFLYLLDLRCKGAPTRLCAQSNRFDSVSERLMFGNIKGLALRLDEQRTVAPAALGSSRAMVEGPRGKPLIAAKASGCNQGLNSRGGMEGDQTKDALCLANRPLETIQLFKGISKSPRTARRPNVLTQCRLSVQVAQQCTT
jgi:hypothetical protein